MVWRQYEDGCRWRVLDDGRIEVEGQGVLRTRGKPLTMRNIWRTHGDDIGCACERFGVPLEWVMGMIPIEAKMNRHPDGGLIPDVVSLRHEPGYDSDHATPHRVSAGIMQTLVSTADSMAKKHGLPPVIRARQLYEPYDSLMYGVAYMAHQLERYEGQLDGGLGLDFVYLTGAYNAGRVRYSSKTPFRLMTYSPTRTERAIRWHNDALAYLREEGIA